MKNIGEKCEYHVLINMFKISYDKMILMRMITSMTEGT